MVESIRMRSRKLFAGVAFTLLATSAAVVPAAEYNGIVQYQGQVTFPAPIPGISATDLTVIPSANTEATGNGEQCEVNGGVSGTTGDNPDGLGSYPDAGQVSADMKIRRGGGPQIPDGQCIVTIRATGTDGVSVSARGSQAVFVDAADIQLMNTVSVDDIVVRQSKAIAGADNDCRKYVKKQLNARTNCNFQLLKKGPAAALKCKDFSVLELPGCDPGNFVEAILALAHGDNDQQTDAMNADDIDEVVLKDQIICQKRFGKASTGFVSKRNTLVQKKCIEAGNDTQQCRDTQTNESKTKLDQISKCAVDQEVDGMTGRHVPDIGAPCDVCIDGLGAIDDKCIRSCLQLALVELSDGVLGDIPECGNGVQQSGEFCDDGNTTPGDCCSASCTVEAGSPEGPMGDGTCGDLLDNDCDGDVDAADPGCQ